MPEERTIQFTCPVCKSGWGAKASMAGKTKTCPKCHTEIIVPSPTGGAAPASVLSPQAPAPKKTAPAAGKKSPSKPLLLWIGIPAALAVVAVVIGIMINNSHRGAAEPQAEAARSNANQAATPAVKEPPVKKEEPASDRKWMQFVENYLRANENKYTIVKTYPTEPLAGAYYHVGGKDDGRWLPIDQPPTASAELSAASLPAAQAKELEKLQKKPLDQVTLDDLVKIENEELKKLPPDELKKLGLEVPKSAKPEDLKKMQEDALQTQKAAEKQSERLRAGRALRVEYDADEGFGRIKRRDVVFVIDADGNVVYRLNTEDFRLGKP
jgi:hypothetical protein